MLNILSDLVIGELQQMSAESNSNPMDHYLVKLSGPNSIFMAHDS